MTSNFSDFKRRVGNSFAFSLFLLTKVPAAFFAGLHLERLEAEEASISLQYYWFNKNPFRSVYFAVLAMAGEISSGILCMGYLYNRKPSISMLLVSQEGRFYKKATGKIIFKCEDGNLINEAVDKAASTSEAAIVVCHSIGRSEQQQVVAEFSFTWSLKARSRA